MIKVSEFRLLSGTLFILKLEVRGIEPRSIKIDYYKTTCLAVSVLISKGFDTAYLPTLEIQERNFGQLLSPALRFPSHIIERYNSHGCIISFVTFYQATARVLTLQRAAKLRAKSRPISAPFLALDDCQLFYEAN